MRQRKSHHRPRCQNQRNIRKRKSNRQTIQYHPPDKVMPPVTGLGWYTDAQASPHFDRHITAAWLAVTLWDSPCCSSPAASLPARSSRLALTGDDERQPVGTLYLLHWNHEIKMRGCLRSLPTNSKSERSMPF